MRCLRTLGVLSVTVVSLVWSMTLETTTPTRYLEDHRTPKIGFQLFSNSTPLISNVDDYLTRINPSLAKVTVKVNSSDTSLVINKNNNNNSSLAKEPKEGRKIKPLSNNNLIKATNVNKTRRTTNKPMKQSSTTPKAINVKMKPIKTKPTTNKSTRKPPAKIKATTATPNKKKPTVKRVITKWKESSSSSNLKQDWYEQGVPYPNPMPEISSSSPPFSIGDSYAGSSTIENVFLEPVAAIDNANISPEIFTNSPSEPLQGVPPILPLAQSSEAVPSANPNESPISTFNLDMLPSSSSDLTRDPSGSGCPTVHIASSVLSPLQRQGCSDLNLVLNTHYHQNQDTRNPAVDTYDASSPGGAAEDPIIDDGLANAEDGGVASDPGTGTYSDGGGAPGGGSSGGTGGSGGSGGDGGGNDGGFKLPDLKPVFEALGYLMRGLWWLLKKLMNPWLYIVPIVLFFKVGFLGILGLFPWWIPLVFLYFSVKSDEPKNTVAHVKHLHKPVLVKHRDGWYWDQHTKTWKDVTEHQQGYRRSRRSDEEEGEDAEDMIDDKIIRFGDKYFLAGTNRPKKRGFKRSR